MSMAFSRSVRSLTVDSYRGTLVMLGVASLLMASWGAWITLARVAVYGISVEARVEVDSEAHPVKIPVAGRIVSAHIFLGSTVKVGDVLAVLGTKEQRLKLQEEETRIRALRSQLVAVKREIQTADRALEEGRQALLAVLAEARALQKQAEAEASFTQEKARRWQALHGNGVVSGVDALEATATAQRNRESERAARLSIARRQHEGKAAEANQRTQLERLRREAVQLRGQLSTSLATIERFKHEIARRSVKAPIAGRLGEVVPLRVGARFDQ